MPDGLLEKIKAVGFVRVVIRPTIIPESLTVIRARELVKKASVSLRGWDYPHIASRDDEHGGTEHHADYVQEWCDWYHHVEFWRMYKSGQFLHYKALREDLSKEGNVPNGPVLAAGSFMYTVTEITEFAHRLRAAGLYKEGATIQIGLGNTSRRRLWVEDPMRMDFISPMVTSSESIIVERSLRTSDLLLGDPKDVSLSIIGEFFSAFGWTPSPDLISSTQMELYNLKLGRDR
ncbi:hypothetical protein RMR10_003520 [Agrobacterium rosae]|uniref:hypothetical protein n=1 Tax=Agrobacterium rosae TaxID=1972867 RepID=UPI002A0F8EB3|nr:hypothetical protein [Agrobacterium rosae]MDX8315247.1 hypothetical protein [Agrobacterium rosae]